MAPGSWVKHNPVPCKIGTLDRLRQRQRHFQICRRVLHGRSIFLRGVRLLEAVHRARGSPDRWIIGLRAVGNQARWLHQKLSDGRSLNASVGIQLAVPQTLDACALAPIDLVVGNRDRSLVRSTHVGHEVAVLTHDHALLVVRRRGEWQAVVVNAWGRIPPAAAAR